MGDKSVQRKNKPFDEVHDRAARRRLLPAPPLEQKSPPGYRNHMLKKEGGIIGEEF